MDLDGIATITPERPELVWGLTALSYLENESVLLLDERQLSIAAKDLAHYPDQFDEFCRYVSSDMAASRATIEGAATRCLRSRWMNAPPLARMLRSHWFWAWFETTRIIVAANEQGPGFQLKQEALGPIRFAYEELARADGRVLVLGPNRVSVSDETLRTALGAFNRTVQACWPGNGAIGARDGALFTEEQLYRHALARPRFGQSDDFATSSRKRVFAEALDRFGSSDTRANLSEVSELSALLSTQAAIGNFDFEGRLTSLVVRRLDRAERRGATDEPPEHAGNPLANAMVDHLIQHREEAGALAWNQYFQESSSLFDAWLARNSYLNIAPHVFGEDAHAKRTWDRISRFLSGLFLCAEATIYRYCVAEPGTPLKLVGSHFEYGTSAQQCDTRWEKMLAAANDPDSRIKSISYRAADNNASAYVPDTSETDGREVLSSPMSNGETARSVLAIPIRLNGGVWGVVEFVSIRGNHFTPLLRSKCEEIAASLSTGFLLANIFETLGRLEGFWSDEFAADRGRRGELCYALSNIFMSDALAVYVGSRSEEGASFGVEEFGSWASPDAKVDTPFPVAISISAIRIFLDGADLVEEVPNPRRGGYADSDRRTFIVRLQAHGTMKWSGALVFSVPYPITIDAGWRQTTFALGQIIAGVISNVSSDASWNKEARRDLRHEYRRIVEGLRGVRTRLTSLSRKIGSKLDLNDRHVLDIIPDDLSDLTLSLEAVSDALLADVYDRLLHGDRRLIAVKRAQEAYIASKKETVSPRDIFHSRFINAINAEPQKRLRVIYNPGSGERLIRMHRGTLSDILGTLADNAAKYSNSSTEIIMTFADGPQRSLQMRISNLGPPLEPEEVDEIFEDGFRGRAARELLPDRGSGRGLRFAREAMELWNGWLDYDWDEPASNVVTVDGKPTVWHRFTLTFPAELLVDRFA